MPIRCGSLVKQVWNDASLVRRPYVQIATAWYYVKIWHIFDRVSDVFVGKIAQKKIHVGILHCASNDKPSS